MPAAIVWLRRELAAVPGMRADEQRAADDVPSRLCCCRIPQADRDRDDLRRPPCLARRMV